MVSAFSSQPSAFSLGASEIAFAPPPRQAPQGRKNLAQGVSPGETVHAAISPAGA